MKHKTIQEFIDEKLVCLFALISLCGCDARISQTNANETNAPHKSEFVRIEDANGSVHFFRPHMVSDITGNSQTSVVDVIGLGSLPLNCSADEAAKRVQKGQP